MLQFSERLSPFRSFYSPLEFVSKSNYPLTVELLSSHAFQLEHHAIYSNIKLLELLVMMNELKKKYHDALKPVVLHNSTSNSSDKFRDSLVIVVDMLSYHNH